MRYSPRRLLLGTLFGGMVLCVPIAFVQSAAQLLVLRVGLGLLAGGSVTLAFTLGGLTIPENLRGSGFGLLTSATLIGNAVSPLVAGTLATIVDLHYVFILNAMLYAISFVWVWWVIGRATSKERQAESVEQKA
jgi:MFS family permease